MPDSVSDPVPPPSPVPAEIMRSFRGFIDKSTQLLNLLELTTLGITSLGDMDLYVDEFFAGKESEAEPKNPEIHAYSKEEKYVNIIDMSNLAKSEIASGFALLHEQALISLWGAFEVTIGDLIAHWIVAKPGIKQRPRFRKIKVKLSDYESMNEYERANHVVELLSTEILTGPKLGIGRYQVLLQEVGLHGDVSAGDERTFIELNEVRNVFVHRQGIADRRIVESCRWLGVNAGDRLIVSNESLLNYFRTCNDYVCNVMERISAACGTDTKSLATGPEVAP